LCVWERNKWVERYRNTDRKRQRETVKETERERATETATERRLFNFERQKDREK